MIGTINGHNATQARAPGGAPCRSSARLLLQTAASLSLAGYCPATAAGRARRRKAVSLRARASLPPAADRRQRGQQARHSVRRASAGTAQPAANEGSSGQKRLASRSARQGHKKDKDVGQQPRPAGGRTGSTPASGSRHQSQDAGAATPQEPARALEPQRRSHKRTACTRETAVPLYQHNFTRIKDDLDGCYRQAERVILQGDQTKALPIGSPAHPFTGSLDGEGHHLTVHLVRRQGDVVLFDTIDHSRISLTLVNSLLGTRNGGRAALIGTMRTDNQVVISRLDNSGFNAIGEGTVEAALVACTTGSGNRLRVEKAQINRFFARSLSRDGKSRALASLGLGVIAAAGVQHINQTIIWGNRLQATAFGVSPGNAPDQERPDTGAFAALLGFMDAGVTAEQDLVSRQELIQGNLVEALVEGNPSDGRSCASLGYSSMDCGRTGVAGSWTGTLWLSQVALYNNDVRARISQKATGGAVGRRPQGGLARATLVSTEPVSRLHLLQRGQKVNPLQAEAAVAQSALLPPTRKAHVLLLDGGDKTVPLFGSWGGPHNCSIVNGPVPGSRQPGTSLIDSAGYSMTSFNCERPAAARALVIDSRQPDDWRWAQALFSDFESAFAGRPVPAGVDNGLHYPGERVQLLVTGAGVDGHWLLVTRQHYSWQPDNAPGGLLRVTRYSPPLATRKPAARLASATREPDSQQGLPQSLAPSRPGFTLHPPEAGDVLLQGTGPIHSLLHHGRLFQLYHQQGQPAQLLSLPVSGSDAPYQLLQYEALPGRARLLSLEGEGELHLWMQQDDNNILQVYGLGVDAFAGHSSSWLHWGFDLSDQPGGPAVLARDGDWLYSLRQSGHQFVSLRRFAISTGKMDRSWQPGWRGSVSDNPSLILDRGHCQLVYPGGLPDPASLEPCTLLVAQLPDMGGAIRWSRLATRCAPAAGH